MAPAATAPAAAGNEFYPKKGGAEELFANNHNLN
jgi:hypothetical protein